MKIWITLAFASLYVTMSSTALANSKIYRQQNADGSVTFTDIPSQHALPVDLPKPQVYTSEQTRKTLEQGSPTGSKKTSAADNITPTIAITNPNDDQTFQNSPHGNVNVQLSITPPLQKSGMQVQFYLNGDKLGEPQTNRSLKLTNLNRGDYQLQVKLLSEGDIVASSQTITFHMQRPMIRPHAN